MPITTKHTTVYVASDGSVHATLEAAQNAERHDQLEDMFGQIAPYGELSARAAAERVVECWSSIKAIMEDDLPAVQAAAETILARDYDEAMDEASWGGANVAPRNDMERSLRPRCEECGNRFNHRKGCSKRSV